MNLPFKKPDLTKDRLKMMVYGDAKVGKTRSVIQFPKAAIIDTEGGTTKYKKTILSLGSQIFNENNFDLVYKAVHALKYEKHEFTTLIIDSSSSLKHSLRNQWARIFDKHTDNIKRRDLQDYGQRYWTRCNSQWATLHRLLETIDMNVIVVAQETDEYEYSGSTPFKTGVTYDGGKKDKFLFDYIFRIKKDGDAKDAARIAICEGERGEIGENKFPEEFEWSYNNFCKLYGKQELERAPEAKELASSAQVAMINKLLETTRIPQETTEKWLIKANVNDFNEMEKSDIQKCIDFLIKQEEEKDDVPY
jgi:hypothetical protein